jgi:integrase
MARRGDGIYQCSKTWWLDFRHDGQRHVYKLGKGISRTVAAELAAVKRAAVLKGEAGIGRKRKDWLFDDPEPHRALVLVGINAGLRVRSEALSLTWPNVDLARGLLTVQGAFAKTGKTRTVPLNRTLREALAVLKEGARSEHVFTRRDGQPLRALRTVFMKACARAKLADVTPHALRHTFASRLTMAGVDLRTIQELGGWRSLKMVEHYAHLSPSHKAEAVERLAQFGHPAGEDMDRSVARIGVHGR